MNEKKLNNQTLQHFSLSTDSCFRNPYHEKKTQYPDSQTDCQTARQPDSQTAKKPYSQRNRQPRKQNNQTAGRAPTMKKKTQYPNPSTFFAQYIY